jgi:thymidylate kinase
MLLALEGLAGAGKSTLRERLLSAASAEGMPLSHIGQFSWLSLPATRTLIALRAGRATPGVREALAAAHLDLELHTRHNIAPALARGPVIADRLTLSTAALLALVHGGRVEDYVGHLANVSAAQPDLTVLLTTPPSVCLERLASRKTERRFGEAQCTAAGLAKLFDQAASAWTSATGRPVLRHPCAKPADLALLNTACLRQLRATTSSAVVK